MKPMSEGLTRASISTRSPNGTISITGAPGAITPPMVLARIALTRPRTGEVKTVRRSTSSRPASCSSITLSSVRSRTSSALASWRKRLTRSCVPCCRSLTWRRTRITSTSLISPLPAMPSAIANSRSSRRWLRRLISTASFSARARAWYDSVSPCTSARAPSTSAGNASGLPSASACNRATAASREIRLARPSFCIDSNRVGSSSANGWPTATCSPSRTRSSRRMPPSRLEMSCSRPSGTTRASARVTMSTSTKQAQVSAETTAASIR